MSDGSFFETECVGTAAWTLVTVDHDPFVTGGSIVPGDTMTMSSI